MSGTLSDDDQRRLEELFDRATELPAAEQAAFATRECGANQALRTELLRLLAAHAGDDHLQRLRADVAPGATLGPGTRIGPYKLLEKIGEGGMGTVYAAEQQLPIVRRVALKLIKPGMDSAQVVARFEAERQALARMAHPNVAMVYDGGTTPDGRPYLAMEFVAGEPVTDYCDRRKLTTRARLELFLQICRGVQHAHLKGLIHRDLKPSNLLVTQQDGVAIPKIIDFGVARAVTGRLAERTLHTLVGQIVGTLDYMSPEQADPTGTDVDTRSDVYSLGVVLYQLTSGLLPFQHLGKGVPLSELQRAIREQDPPTPSTGLRTQAAKIAPLHGTDQRTLVRQLAGDLDWICMKALEKDPARRYQSAAELADDVRRHLADEPVLAGRPGLLYRARKFVRRHRAGVATGVLLGAGLVVGIVGIVSGRLESVAAAQSIRLQKPYADAQRLAMLLQQADTTLWPQAFRHVADVQTWIDGLETWLDDARALVAELPDHRADRRALEEHGPPWSWEDQARHDSLTQLIEGLAALQDTATGLLGGEDAVSPQHGWSITKRLVGAKRLAAGFAPGGEYAEAWSRSLPAILAAYPGMQLEMQVGLVPLGQDPVSGLWEFAHLRSGAPAARDATGRVVLSAESGIVLVLIPGGTFHIGAQSKDPDGPNHDPLSFPGTYDKPNFEGPPTQVDVAPFFLSKYEMTQAQWERCTGTNPSLVQSGLNLFHAPTHPVNQVDWDECAEVLRWLGLVLPHEQQWEYAARAGTTGSWWTADEARLVAAENLLGQGDGHLTIAPVGTFAANPWGLYDVLGNVSEWCSNRPWIYGTVPDSDVSTLLEHVARGGSARDRAAEARSARRRTAQRMTNPALGLRPARAIVDS